MKIGFVLDDSLDKTDGVQQYVLTLGHWLQHEGHEVHYLVGHTERTDLAHVHSLSRNLQVHFNQNRMSTPLPAKRSVIRELLAREAFDVLHVQMPYSPFLAGRIVKAADPTTAVVGTFHIIPYSWFERLASKALGLLLWRNLRRFDATYSVSLPAKAFARQSFRLQSHLLPNVVDVSQFAAAQPLRQYRDSKVTIVFLGRLVERKGCLHLLKALAYLHERNDLQRVRVLICGKGPLRPELEDFVARHHLGKIVRFVGFVSDHEKVAYLASADIAVFPSTGGESFGIVLIEAMAAGAQVVLGGNNAGYRFVLGERPDQLVDPQDIPAFAKTLKHFINSDAARKRAHKWQADYVHQFDVRSVGTTLLGSYREAIAKRRPSMDNEG
jgi:phosphatidylinositol alpha-mannosyltransferase